MIKERVNRDKPERKGEQGGADNEKERKGQSGRKIKTEKERWQQR